MATPGSALNPREVVVLLKKGPKTKENPSGITITPYSFCVSKSEEEVMWVCLDPGAKFEVNFNFGGEGSPFTESKFTHDRPRSGWVNEKVTPDKKKKYHYTVTVDGETHNSPDGQVDP